MFEVDFFLFVVDFELADVEDFDGEPDDFAATDDDVVDFLPLSPDVALGDEDDLDVATV